MKPTSGALRCLFCLAAAMAAGLSTSPAHAQQSSGETPPPSSSDIAQARELLNQGIALRNKGDVLGAIEKLRAAHALGRTPITGSELGRAYMAAGRLVEAREAFLSVGRLTPQPEETGRSRSARAESAKLAEQLRARIPSLTLRVTGVTADSVAVTVDGATVPAEALAAPRFVNPGTHALFARSTSGGTAEMNVDLKEGESRDVELKIVFAGGSTTPAPAVAAAPAPSPPSAPEPTPGWHATSETTPSPQTNWLAWALLGGGAAVGVAGVVLMIVESNNASVAAQHNDKNTYDNTATAWTAGLVGTFVGAGTVVAGSILFAVSANRGATHVGRRPIWIALGSGVTVGGTW